MHTLGATRQVNLGGGEVLPLPYTWNPQDTLPSSQLDTVTVSSVVGAAYLDDYDRLRGERCRECGAVTNIQVGRRSSFTGDVYRDWYCERHVLAWLPKGG